jgi:hypothetical protein
MAWYGSGARLGHRTEGIVMEFETTSEMTMYRFHRSSEPGHRYGPWFTDAEEINKLINSGASPTEIRSRYAIPKDGDIDQVSELYVNPGTTVRTGTVGPWGELSGGGTQYAVREPSLKKNVDYLTASDYPGSWSEESTELSKFLNEN